MDIKGCFSLVFFKKHKRKIIFLSVIGLWFIYFLWGIVIALRTVLVDSIPVWETHILAGLIAGLTFASIMKFRGCSRIDALGFFIEGAVVGSICVLNIYLSVRISLLVILLSMSQSINIRLLGWVTVVVVVGYRLKIFTPKDGLDFVKVSQNSIMDINKVSIPYG